MRAPGAQRISGQSLQMIVRAIFALKNAEKFGVISKLKGYFVQIA